MKGFLILSAIFIVLGLGVMVITENGGWHGGCTGHCGTCHESHCEDPKKKKEQEQDNV